MVLGYFSAFLITKNIKLLNAMGHLNLMISVIAELIGLYSLANIVFGPAVVLSYFLWMWDTPSQPEKKEKNFEKRFRYIVA